MRTRSLLICLAVLLSLCLPPAGAARPAAATQTVYVDAANGSNATGDGSAARPWRTLTYALAHVAAGDTVTALPGTYNQALGEAFPIVLPAGVNLQGSGREGTIIAGMPEVAVISIGPKTNPLGSAVRLSGLTVQGGKSGLEVVFDEEQAATPAIEDLRACRNETGVLMTFRAGRDTARLIAPVIRSSELISNTLDGLALSSPDGYSANRMEPLLERSVVRGNGRYGVYIRVHKSNSVLTPRIVETHISGNGQDGVKAFGTYTGITAPQIERSWLVDNAGYGFHWSIGENFGVLQATITNTVIAGNLGGGAYLNGGSYYTGWAHLINCTVVDNQHYGINWQQGYNEVGPIVINSILWNPNADDLYASNNGWNTRRVQFCDVEDGDFAGQEGNFSADPLLQDRLHLGACSPAIDAGTSARLPTTDLEGQARPLGSAPDVGADEADLPCLLRADKQVSQAQAKWGDVLRYTITLADNGLAGPASVLLTDTLPAALAYLPGSLETSQGNASYAAGTITWPATLAPGAQLTLSVQARVMQGDALVLNRTLVDAGPLGLYRSPAARTVVAPLVANLPVVYRNHCFGPFLDDFSNPATRWPVRETELWSYGYVDGEYRLYAKQGDALAAISRLDRAERPIVQVDARQVSAGNGSLGLICALRDDWSEFCTAEILPASQEWAILRFSGGSWSVLAHGTSARIRPGQETNRLRIAFNMKIYGTISEFAFLVNGVQLSTFQQDTSVQPARLVGLIASAEAAGWEARFDNYKFVADGCPEYPKAVGAGALGLAEPFETRRGSIADLEHIP